MSTGMSTPTGRNFSPQFKAGLRAFTALHTFIYRLSGGRLLNSISSAPVLLLTTIGHRTGKRRTRPLVYLADGDCYVVVASAAGASQHPAWIRNLQADPVVSVQVGSRKLRMHAEIAYDEERARLWPQLVKLFPGFAEYQQSTSRELPVVVLCPLGAPRIYGLSAFQNREW